MIYNIPAKPTIYKGIHFRSRLEATWAAFFDLLKWEWVYEPFDLNGWFPDFAIRKYNDVNFNTPLLVEVKPIMKFDQITADKMVSACCYNYTNDYPLSDRLSYELLLVGLQPFYDNDNEFWEHYDLENFDYSIGWLLDEDEWAGAPFGRWKIGNGQIGFCHSIQSFRDRITGGYDGGCFGALPLKNTEISNLWGRAKITTRFKY